MAKKIVNRFYDEEEEEGMKFSSEGVTEEERKRAEAFLRELSERGK